MVFVKTMHAGCNKFKQYRKYTEKVKVNPFPAIATDLTPTT